MLSESQERMLLVAKQGREDEVERIFEKWDLHAVAIGEVTGDGMLRVKNHGDGRRRDSEPRADRRSAALRPPVAEPQYLADGAVSSISTRSGRATQPCATATRSLLALLASPAIASKRWVYRQYDHMVRTNTINVPGMGAGVVRVKDTDARSRCRSTATAATATSIRGAARCSPSPRRRETSPAPARSPLAATNSLNFGNPERPEIMSQLAKAVEGIGEACRALGTPITGGNVSLYNETDGRAIYPTPVIGVVGLLEHADRLVARRFQSAGDVVVLLGEGRGELGGSEYLKLVHGLVRGVPPRSTSRPSGRCRRCWSSWRTPA